jgi:chromate transporter
MRAGDLTLEPSLAEIALQWGRIGCVGFGGPPAHVALFRDLCVTRRRWLSDEQFERALAAVNLLPGPASTQLAIYCGWRLRGPAGALLGGLGFVLPGLLAMLALAAAFLSRSPPSWLRGAGMGAGAAVAAVAVRAGVGVAAPILRRAARRAPSGRLARALVPTAAYALSGAVGAALAGPWLVVILLACGAGELARQRLLGEAGWLWAWTLPHWRDLLEGPSWALRRATPTPLALAASADPGGAAALAWTAFKVGALAFGGGFVIVPLMQSDAVDTYHWMTHGQFLNAVALGQVTPGPVMHTVAAVGYSAAGVPGALLAALIAFAPSFSFILLGARRFERLLVDERMRAFLGGAAPAAAGAIIGAAVPLGAALSQSWQLAVLAGAGIALLVLRRGIVATLLAAALAGLCAALLGASIPR